MRRLPTDEGRADSAWEDLRSPRDTCVNWVRGGENVALQPFCASFRAGVIGAMTVRYQLSSSLRLVAVCPCMILVPGPSGRV
jgi:hypothetical protein